MKLRGLLLLFIALLETFPAQGFVFGTSFWKRRSTCPVQSCTTSTSTTLVNINHDSTEDRYVTIVNAIYNDNFTNGALESSVTLNVPSSHSTVTDAITTAQNDLTTRANNTGEHGQVQISSSSSSSNSTSHEYTETGRNDVITTTTETTPGPATIFIGADRGQMFEVPSGQINQNVNTNTETRVDVDHKIITTHTTTINVTCDFFWSLFRLVPAAEWAFHSGTPNSIVVR